MHENPQQKQKLADALKRMTASQAPEEPIASAESQTPAPAAPQPRVRPAVPTLSSARSEPAQPMIDSDRVPVPAPSPEVFMSRLRKKAGAPSGGAGYGSLKARRTLVPILLTLGVMLLTLGGLWFITDEDSPFRALHVIVPVSLILVGVVLFMLGIVNALHLGHILRSEAAARPR